MPDAQTAGCSATGPPRSGRSARRGPAYVMLPLCCCRRSAVAVAGICTFRAALEAGALSGISDPGAASRSARSGSATRPTAQPSARLSVRVQTHAPEGAARSQAWHWVPGGSADGQAAARHWNETIQSLDSRLAGCRAGREGSERIAALTSMADDLAKIPDPPPSPDSQLAPHGESRQRRGAPRLLQR